MGGFGSPYLGKVAAAARAALSSPTCIMYVVILVLPVLKQLTLSINLARAAVETVGYFDFVLHMDLLHSRPEAYRSDMLFVLNRGTRYLSRYPRQT